MSLRDIDDDVSRLVELDRPAWNACKVPGIRAFAPSRQQKKALGMFRHNWTRSLLNVIRYVPDHVRVELHKWLQIKREMFEEALRNVRRALHFDVLVLGIVSGNEQSFPYCGLKSSQTSARTAAGRPEHCARQLDKCTSCPSFKPVLLSATRLNCFGHPESLAR